MVQLAKSTDDWGSRRELRCSGAPLVRHLNHQYLPCSGSSCLVESTTRLWSFKREHLLQLPPVFWKLWWIWYSCTRIGRLKLVPPLPPAPGASSSITKKGSGSTLAPKPCGLRGKKAAVLWMYPITTKRRNPTLKKSQTSNLRRTVVVCFGSNFQVQLNSPIHPHFKHNAGYGVCSWGPIYHFHLLVCDYNKW